MRERGSELRGMKERVNLRSERRREGLIGVGFLKEHKIDFFVFEK
jgi:hypothetical protein